MAPYTYYPQRARAAAETALSLDPDAAEAYVVRGRLAWSPASRYQHAQAIREYQHALALNPLLGEAHFQLGQVFGHTGFLDAYLDHARQALALDPANPRFQEAIGQALLYQGKYQEAVDAFTGLPADLHPLLIGYQMAWALFSSGRRADAAAVINDYLRIYPSDVPGTFSSMKAIILADQGDHEAAEQLIAVAAGKDRNSLQFHHTAYNIAVAYALLGKPADAFEWLDITAEEGFPCVALFEHDANLRSLRTDPRFAQLIARLRDQAHELRALAPGAS
jgi:tetratricopeptide (TPR) repeat protein